MEKTREDIGAIRAQLNELSERVTDLNKCYRVLNEAHLDTETRLVRLESQVETTVAIAKWLISPIALISFLLQLAVALGWV